MARCKISERDRLKVYRMYDGHCAYCGQKIEYKKMQVDHVQSVYAHDGKNELSNYMPACRMCNFYKSTLSIEDFRERVQTLLERLNKLFIYRLAIRYGLVVEHRQDIVFYFEVTKKGEE